MLQARSITRRFGATIALDAVDFEAAPGEIHALLGENGAGKTTLMRVLAGAVRPDAGSITLDDLALRPGSPRDALDAGIAAVHQSSMPFERLTWEENLALGGGSSTAGAACSRPPKWPLSSSCCVHFAMKAGARFSSRTSSTRRSPSPIA